MANLGGAKDEPNAYNYQNNNGFQLEDFQYENY